MFDPSSSFQSNPFSGEGGRVFESDTDSIRKSTSPASLTCDPFCESTGPTMFNGALDPDLFKLAQEQISRMSPAELAKIQQQMMSNPELMRMATESMKNMRPEDMRHAAEQLKNVAPEELSQIGEKMANASPEEIAAVSARADAQMNYQLSGAEMLKKEGNRLHSLGKFSDASQKYLLAKKNLTGNVSSKGKMLLQACSLNLMSCYLKTKQYEDCIKEGTEVLAFEAKNVKALYRRGQAFKELGQLEDAVHDLGEAHRVSPDDETIVEVLRDVEKLLSSKGGDRGSRGLVIEEITEEDEAVSSASQQTVSVEQHSEKQESVSNTDVPSQRSSKIASMSNSESLQALKDDPDAIRSFQNFISKADPATMAAMGGGNAGEINPEMIKTASNMISKMSPEELQKMLQLASSFQGDNNPFGGGGPSSGGSIGSRPGSIPDVSPEMLKTATDMMNKMPPDELQRMFEMTASLRGVDPSNPPASSNANQQSSRSRSNLSDAEQASTISRNDISSETSSSSSLRGGFPSQSDFSASPADLQEQMRNQMKDPSTRQMFTSMVKNMSPEMMASMSEQFGFKLSKEDAEKAQQAMSSLSPEDLDKMMRWADRVQRGVETAKKTKNWLLGRPGVILAICMLILAMILHRLGYIG